VHTRVAGANLARREDLAAGPAANLEPEPEPERRLDLEVELEIELELDPRSPRPVDLPPVSLIL